MKSLADRYLPRWDELNKLSGGHGRKIDSDRVKKIKYSNTQLGKYASI